MSLRQLLCSHEVYIDELHRFENYPGSPVVSICHKCEKPLKADCGLHLNARLVGYRPKPCEACNGTGKKP